MPEMMICKIIVHNGNVKGCGHVALKKVVLIRGAGVRAKITNHLMGSTSLKITCIASQIAYFMYPMPWAWQNSVLNPADEAWDMGGNALDLQEGGAHHEHWPEGHSPQDLHRGLHDGHVDEWVVGMCGICKVVVSIRDAGLRAWLRSTRLITRVCEGCSDWTECVMQVVFIRDAGLRARIHQTHYMWYAKYLVSGRNLRRRWCSTGMMV